MEVVQAVALVSAMVTVGVMAGVFFAYTVAVMPGLGRSDDRTFVGAFQQIDHAIVRPVFLLTFLGALLLTGVAAGVNLGEPERLPWIGAAFLLYLIGFVLTFRVNVPLNNAIKAAGDPDRIDDLAGVRARFNEARWRRSNLVRTVVTTLALGCLAIALVLTGSG
jgi:uncharacterized membrane protein